MAKRKQNIEALQAQDAGGIIEMVLQMIDSYVAASNKEWLKFVWTTFRQLLTGFLPPPAVEELEQKATTLDTLIEFVLTYIDKWVEEQPRWAIKMLWRMIRPQIAGAQVASFVMAA